jgi:RNA polymerase sigma-70 factor (ECF subfamily)
MSDMTAISPEALLQHAGFVKALARELLRSADRVDDVVQETMLAALRKPPRDRTRLRAWLGAVGRRIALSERRSDGRRPRREREAARKEALPSAAEVVAQLETQRRVVEAVQQLDEPYRSTITHRFFHERSVREIAEELDVPVKTVESRLTRALRQLRARLDEEHGGGGRAWAVALLPLAFPSSPVTAATAGAAVAVPLLAIKITAVAACAGVAVLGALWLGHDRQPSRKEAVHAPVHPVAPVPEATPSAAPTPEPQQTAEAPEWSEGIWRARFLVRQGALPEKVVAHCEVRPRSGSPKKWIRTLEPDAQGAIAISGLPEGTIKVQIRTEEWAPWSGDFLITKSNPDCLPVYVQLTRGSTLRLTLRDVSGNPLVGEESELNGAVTGPQKSDEFGRIVFPRLASAVYNFHWKNQIWYPWINGKRDTDLTLISDAVVQGTVIDEVGAARSGAEVRFRRDQLVWTSAWADDEGRYRVVGLARGPWRVTAVGKGFAALAGTIERDARPVAVHSVRFLPGCIRGRVVTEGQGVPRAHITCWGEQWLGTQLGEQGEFAFWGLPPREYVVNASIANHGPEIKVKLERGEIRDVELNAEQPRDGTVELDVTLPDGTHPDRLQFFLALSSLASVSAAPKPIAPGRFAVRMHVGRGRITIGATRVHGSAEIDVEVHEHRTRVVRVELPPPNTNRRIDATR